MGATLSLDVGIHTGIALLHEALIATDTVQDGDLAEYLGAVCVTLAYQNVDLDAVVAERPLTIFRSALSRDLEALCTTVQAIFPQVRWIDAGQWKGQQELLRRYARSRHLVAWKHTRTRHERDALLIALWRQDVLIPANFA